MINDEGLTMNDERLMRNDDEGNCDYAGGGGGE